MAGPRAVVEIQAALDGLSIEAIALAARTLIAFAGLFRRRFLLLPLSLGLEVVDVDRSTPVAARPIVILSYCLTQKREAPEETPVGTAAGVKKPANSSCAAGMA